MNTIITATPTAIMIIPLMTTQGTIILATIILATIILATTTPAMITAVMIITVMAATATTIISTPSPATGVSGSPSR